ncbi:ester cyclase [Danxiaibacter flavus]|uniref:Ester cyclase n=1 Tax=Danxiaibacter flavus TaxID=3049108 RepID=A0ABV3ZAR3_9BACT|nr:ester cyclase [Chitinophagaceae bacterium DXS]
MKKFIPLALIALLATSCGNNPSSTKMKDTAMSTNPAMESKTSMTEKNKAAALASIQAFNNHNADDVLKDATADAIDYGDGSMPPTKGKDSIKAGIQTFLKSFPDVKGENLMTFAEGDQVVIIGDWSGTFKNDFMGMKANGKSYKYKDADIFTFNSSGQMTEHRSIQSGLTMWSQLGVKMK